MEWTGEISGKEYVLNLQPQVWQESNNQRRDPEQKMICSTLSIPWFRSRYSQGTGKKKKKDNEEERTPANFQLPAEKPNEPTENVPRSR